MIVWMGAPIVWMSKEHQHVRCAAAHPESVQIDAPRLQSCLHHYFFSPDSPPRRHLMGASILGEV